MDIHNQYAPLFEGQQKKIQCTKELIFNVSAHLMTEDADGKDMSCEEVVVKNFHIPVPEDTNHKPFMEAFFSFLENCLSNSAKHAYSNPNTEDDKNE